MKIDEAGDTRIETRSAAGIDGVDFAQRIITVIAVPYEETAQVYYRQEMWNEVFSRSAFLGIETRDKRSRIPATAVLEVPNRDHSGGRLIGRVVEADPHSQAGLVASVKVSRTNDGDDTLELANDHALSASVGFMVKNRTDEVLDKRTRTRRINRAFLDHLAFVGVPAYAGAQVLAVRGADLQPESELQKLNTPLLDEFLEDPVFGWASKRISG